MRRQLIGLLLAGLASACTVGPPVEDYTERLARARAEKDASFESSSDSPVPAEKRKEFLPLSYYKIDEAYAVPAELEVSETRARLQMPTSTGKLRDYEKIGTLKFTLNAERRQLSVFSEAGQPISRLFVPFADQTSGSETYAAGRYMELDPTATGIYVVDFNIAYHPFCYYSAEYDCPYPPAENRLEIPIRAGERLPPAGSGSR